MDIFKDHKDKEIIPTLFAHETGKALKSGTFK